MVVLQKRSQRKPTGGRYKKIKVKRLAQMGNQPIMTRVGELKKKSVRVRGGNIKLKILRADVINVMDPETRKCQKATVSSTVESPDNRNYVRRNILTKGAVVKTNIGMVKITSRPGQVGTLNGILVKV